MHNPADLRALPIPQRTIHVQKMNSVLQTAFSPAGQEKPGLGRAHWAPTVNMGRHAFTPNSQKVNFWHLLNRSHRLAWRLRSCGPRCWILTALFNYTSAAPLHPAKLRSSSHASPTAGAGRTGHLTGLTHCQPDETSRCHDLRRNAGWRGLAGTFFPAPVTVRNSKPHFACSHSSNDAHRTGA